MLFSLAIILADSFAVGENRAQPWWDYPGLELWKFLNLLLFAAVMVYILKRPLTDAFRARRETIRRDLFKAQEERDRALASFAEVQSRLARLGSEVAAIHEHSRSEARGERERIARDTELEMLKLREQAQREIVSAGKMASHELRRLAAHQSVKLAEEIIRREIGPEDDAKLIDMNVEQLGRA